MEKIHLLALDLSTSHVLITASLENLAASRFHFLPSFSLETISQGNSLEKCSYKSHVVQIKYDLRTYAVFEPS